MSAAVDANDARPLLLIVGSSYAAFREYIFRSVSSGYRIWLFNPVAPQWESPYIVGSSIVNCMDAAAIVAAAREIPDPAPLAGVFCYDEAYIEPAAHASAALGFDTLDPEAVARCRDKSATREVVRALGLPQPESIPVASLAEAELAATKIGYPVILKPRNLGASLGVVRVDSPEELAGQYQRSLGVKVPGVREFDAALLVEQLVEGPEISIDAVVYRGRCVPLVLAHKQLGTAPGFEFEEVGHEVWADEPLLRDPRFTDMLTRVHEAMGFTNGATHTEFKVTPDGLVLIELNARMGGGLIPLVGLLAQGIDVSLAAADAACGREPRAGGADHPRNGVVGFSFPAYDMAVTEVVVHQDRIGPPVADVGVAAAPGMRLRLPPLGMSHSAYVIAVSDSLDEARAAAQRAPELIEVRGEPLEVAAG